MLTPDIDSDSPVRKPTVNLTASQYDKIRRAAEKIGLTVPAYLRSKALEAADASLVQ